MNPYIEQGVETVDSPTYNQNCSMPTDNSCFHAPNDVPYFRCVGNSLKVLRVLVHRPIAKPARRMLQKQHSRARGAYGLAKP